jgi:SAM-dependent methyltransferase
VSGDFEAMKQGQKAMWSAGDYPDISRWIAGVAEQLVQRIGAAPGQELLDVATGTGNVAIPAAQAGAHVTGLDITPKLLATARERAEQAGLHVHFIEGDAEQLPFEDGSFDRVTSCFGVMFAPHHQQAANELVRVARPGARIGVAAWTPSGVNGQMFQITGSYMPPPPPEAIPAAMWGDEDHVRGLFSASGALLSFERHTVTFKHDSPEGWFEYNERVLGPLVLAKSALEPQGRYEELRSELIGLYSGANEADDGSLNVQAEYLLTIAELPA